jgi:hypothetical protein
MSYFGVPVRNGLPIGLGSVAGFGVQQFSPADLFSANEQGAWYDPSDLTTLFTDSAGTVPVTGVEQFVGRMNDKSGRGNHATSTGTKRPKLAARYNLLTYTEQFDNAGWTKNNVTVTANAGVAPNGTTTADLVYPTTSGADRYVWQSVASQITGTNYKTTVSLKASGINFAYIYNARGDQLFYVNLATGATSNVGTNITNIVSVRDSSTGWVTVSFESVLTAITTAYIFVGAANAAGSTSVTANGTDGVLVWGADLRPASQATGLIGPTYQRVVDAATYDAVGYLPYLSFDGIDDSMSTGSIDATAVDKAQVFAGVRKLSDAGFHCFVGNGTPSVDTRSFALFSTYNGSGDYACQLSGAAAPGVAETINNFSAPRTNVTTWLLNAAGANTAAAMQARVNGASESLSELTAYLNPSTFFANRPLVLGVRSDNSFYYNGWMSSIIVRFGANLSQSQIESTESWVNGKTGAY